MKPHPQADILRAIADGKTIQAQHRSVKIWEDLEKPLTFIGYAEYELRIKPETMNLAGHEFPAPVSEPLKAGQEYWIPRLDYGDYSEPYAWTGTNVDCRRLERNLIHRTKEAASAQGLAMIAAVGGEV